MTGYTLQRGRSEIFERVTDSHRGSSAVGKVADCIFFSLSYLVRFSVLKTKACHNYPFDTLRFSGSRRLAVKGVGLVKFVL